ncbi:3-hydroxyisobutyryl-CoA hydrolase [Castellaniella defragrans 65Phen]|uniref:3-hydroxyisobutyryl-CoA hydrolase n=1 Tax=Castellaniella defragrans (strain DSM 12143 / CCUG 39792 / 65Phen) TaxID=1437824 RepID=W8X4L2_CASD6|nr:enoyl-CoA hydratase/isomerase family protein [Castellaniella defragrans]CDM24461.1 3-hydroxyisobutyryl-CoA hydrolase [Castellaniella defragrans 65Phen]
MSASPLAESAGQAPVLFQELPAGGGRRIGVATLNSPRTLNGLSLPMCRLLDDRLRAWAGDDGVAAVVLKGAGGKAFCAGGDLHSLYRAMLESPASDAWANVPAREFFETEYRLDHLIHRYPKPVLCWADGIVMGGGVGLMLGASHRIVTGATRFAMPEVTIGLYPDVAGTWMLSRLPRGIGAFLAFTGAQLGAADCLHYGLADRVCEAGEPDALLAALAATDWTADPACHAAQVDAALDACQVPAPEPGPLQRHADAIRLACGRADFLEIAAAIAAWKDHPDPWLARAAATFLAGSPGSARLSHTLLARARHQSLAETFRMEFAASLHCCAEPDFREGIRALLIDKDKSPRWNPATHEQATADWARRFLVPPVPEGEPHPLADLGP